MTRLFRIAIAVHDFSRALWKGTAISRPRKQPLYYSVTWSFRFFGFHSVAPFGKPFSVAACFAWAQGSDWLKDPS